MAAVPYATHNISKVLDHMKQQQEEIQVSDAKQVLDTSETPSILPCADQTPHKYNSKLMNSIWGLYNRYAPDAFQKNSEGKPMGNVTTAPETKAWSLWNLGRFN